MSELLRPLRAPPFPLARHYSQGITHLRTEGSVSLLVKCFAGPSMDTGADGVDWDCYHNLAVYRTNDGHYILSIRTHPVADEKLA